MKGRRRSSTAAAALAALFAAGCGTASGQTSGTPQPAPHQHPTPQAVAVPAGARWSEADVRFLQGMIPHHAQALEMTALAESRAARADVRLVAQRITVSQQDEIAQMQRWLRARGQAIPDAHAHHTSHAAMPGMLTPQEMERLAAATGAEFDRLFLEGMIRHHEGALAMVAELFATQGAAQESELYAIASEVDADQRMEIARMRAMLDAVPPSTRR
jgi:uncharacterized protein (DUF305 family)